ncbi:NAD(P)/FAD-dependent oxidoreductase [Bradyrhizobium sp. sBnM-33]|uniref:NAD(P)/FAD-dependent oxidoreductase n=1 Tax=Bradyrhizobium sp. sBnM-33 TaxID=2831780 RepID=UPI001BCBDDBE|nr:FAD-dependent oxidoreductase [Bradyrhizobium sp. sBnM-33]WOH52478.1 FAD-dependent oxidoreductase [Bradyrhizobium sp. sBnM-33]
MVIVGAGEAGTAGAIALREGGWRGPVILIGNEAMLPYERPPLSKSILIEEMNPGPKLLVTPKRLAEFAIDYLEGRNVERIDRAAHTVTLSDGAQLIYERLLLTTGARPRKLSVSVAPGSRIATLRTYADALAISRIVRRGCELVVIGGGFIGLEVAASAVSRGASVTVVEVGPRLLTRAVPAPIAELIRAKHERAGVCIETGAIVEGIEANERRAKVVLADGRTHLADLVLVGVGAVPNVELAQAAGLAVDNGIVLDETLTTSDPHVFAAGDCCSFPHPLYGERIRLEAWRNARQQGAAAAANMLGANRPYENVPWFWSDQYDETLQIAGLCREEYVPVARSLGPKGQLFFYLAADGRLVAACGFGCLGSIAKEIRFAEMMIGRRLAPKAEALADPAVNMKSLLV